MVGKWLRFKEPAFTRRAAIRGCAFFKENHGFEPKFLQFFGKGVRSGVLPCDGNSVYWFFTWTPSNQGKPIKPTWLSDSVFQYLTTSILITKVT